MAAKEEGSRKLVADNRKARFHYEILDSFEAGIALTGTATGEILRQPQWAFHICFGPAF